MTPIAAVGVLNPSGAPFALLRKPRTLMGALLGRRNWVRVTRRPRRALLPDRATLAADDVRAKQTAANLDAAAATDGESLPEPAPEAPGTRADARTRAAEQRFMK
jgi:hypothetical protein